MLDIVCKKNGNVVYVKLSTLALISIFFTVELLIAVDISINLFKRL